MKLDLPATTGLPSTTFPRRLRALGRPLRPLSFHHLWYLTFLFGWVVFEMYRAFWAVSFSWSPVNPTRGFPLSVSGCSYPLEDWFRLQGGGRVRGIDPALDDLVFIEIDAQGYSWESQSIELGKQAPWPDSRNGVVVLIRPLSDATYGQVAKLLDWLEVQHERLQEPRVSRIFLFACGDDPANKYELMGCPAPEPLERERTLSPPPFPDPIVVIPDGPPGE